MSSKAASLFHQAAQLSDAECAELYEKLGMRLGKTTPQSLSCQMGWLTP